MRLPSTLVVGVPLLVALVTAVPPPIAAQTFRGGDPRRRRRRLGRRGPGGHGHGDERSAPGSLGPRSPTPRGDYAFSELPLGRLHGDREPRGLRLPDRDGRARRRPRPPAASTSSSARADAPESVEVVGAARPSSTRTSNTQGGTIDGEQAAELPVNGRDFTNLLSLVPGADVRPRAGVRLAGLLRLLQHERQPRPREQLPARRHRHERRLPQPARDQRGRASSARRPRSCRWTRSTSSPSCRAPRPSTAATRGPSSTSSPSRAPTTSTAASSSTSANDALGARNYFNTDAEPEERVPQQPVRRLAGRADRQGPDLLLRGLRGAARERRPAHPGPRADRRRDCRRDRRERRGVPTR